MKEIEQALKEWLLYQIDFTSRCMQDNKNKSVSDLFRGEQKAYVETLNELNKYLEIAYQEKKNKKGGE